MAENLEIERKFLVEYPDCDKLNAVRQIEILQTYLENGSGGSQRRVRKITENGTDVYFYTEKEFITAVTRKENEYEISAENYAELLKEKRRIAFPSAKKEYVSCIRSSFLNWISILFQMNLQYLNLNWIRPNRKYFTLNM